jgi:ubiquinone/menaquinone biosynthesis C-methylase UbiE
MESYGRTRRPRRALRPISAQFRGILHLQHLQSGCVSEAVHKRFSETAAALAALQDRRAAETEARLARLLTVSGNEVALDVGTGAGAIAIGLAPLVQEVIGIDVVPELLAEANKRAPENVRFIEGDARELPFPSDSFDLVSTARTLHHVERPEIVLSEMSRVLKPGGTMLVIDQLAPGDPLAAMELNRFERARDETTTRILADVDFRLLFDSNGLVLRRADTEIVEREIESYLDLAGCSGQEREQARSLAPVQRTVHYGWYVLEKPRLY